MKSAASDVHLSILLVSYHSQKDLERCLPVLFEQAPPNTEVIVIDNAPGDGTAEWLVRTYPDVNLISNGDNTGYAGGNNLGIAKARGEYVLILNPDTVLGNDALAELLAAAKDRPDALLTPKLLQPGGAINACGLQMHYTGLATCRGLGAEADRYERYRGTHQVFLASGAALLAKREIFLKLEGFDERFFMYLEDVDLSLRARLQGLEVYCAASATVYHHYSLGMNPQKFFYLERNRLLLLLKLYERATLRALIPALLLTEGAVWAFALLKGPAYMRTRLRALFSVLQMRAAIREARLAVQRQRRLDDGVLLEKSLERLPLEQLVRSSSLTPLLHRILDPIYQLLRPQGRIPKFKKISPKGV